MYVDWSEDLSVGVKEIDQQHKRFIVIMNDLYEALENQDERIVLGDIITQLAAYANYHFLTEEKYMDEYDYEDTAEHKREHQALRDDIAVFGEKYQQNEEKYAQELLHFVKNWLSHHLLEIDKKYTKCFNEHGLY